MENIPFYKGNRWKIFHLLKLLALMMRRTWYFLILFSFINLSCGKTVTHQELDAEIPKHDIESVNWGSCMETKETKSKQFQIRHIRHATIIISVSGKRLLVDAMLAQQGANPPIPLTKNRVNNPLVELPVSLNAFDDIDGVLLTHTHIDHFDEAAIKYLPKDKPLFSQPSDRKKLQLLGFNQVISIQQEYTWDTLRIVRVKANHGTGFITSLMGYVSGYVIQSKEGHSIYIAGDAVYDETLEKNISRFHPKTIIVNAGSARMLFGSPITMTCEDVSNVCRYSPGSKIVAVHMDAINHCIASRKDLIAHLKKENLSHQVIIPNDGEIINF